MITVRLLALVLGLMMSSGVVPAQSPKPAKASAAKTAPASPSATPQAKGDLLDVNHATAAELKTLPGIGDAYSLAIIKHRPYKNKAQLRSMGVIPPATYQKIKDQIIAKQ